METKRCNKCGELKELSTFYKNKNNKDGYFSKCKDCHYEQVKIYRVANIFKVREWGKKGTKKYTKLNHEKVKQQRILYYEKNAEKEKERKKKWRYNNKEKTRLYNIKWDLNNKEKRIEYERKKRILHKCKINETKKKINKKHSLLLTDYYISSVCFNSTVHEIPKELIEAKRAQIQLLRACKE